MKKTRFLAVILIVVMCISGYALADTSATARLSNSKFNVNGEKVQIVAYNIKDNNYLRLRDLGRAVNFATDYDSATKSVYIDSTKPYADDGAVPPQDMPSETTAKVSNMPIYVNGKLTPMTAYNISGNNFVKLRDVGQALDFATDWESASNTVMIDTSKPYTPESASIVNGTGSGQFSSTPIQAKYLDGTDRSPVDYSQQANPAIFTDKLTRGAYNAIHDTMLKKDDIIKGNNEKHVNPYYDYAYCVSSDYESVNYVLGSFFGYYIFTDGAEAMVKNIYEFPNYFVCKVSLRNENFKVLSDNIIRELNNLPTEREKIQSVVGYMCERMTYNAKARDYGMEDVFKATLSNPVEGACYLYTGVFQYLCDRLNIPCISVASDTHAWNAVYVDGEWLYVDVSAIDLGWDDAFLVENLSRHTDAYPSETLFAKELLKPGSTIK